MRNRKWKFQIRMIMALSLVMLLLSGCEKSKEEAPDAGTQGARIRGAAYAVRQEGLLVSPNDGIQLPDGEKAWSDEDARSNNAGGREDNPQADRSGEWRKYDSREYDLSKLYEDETLYPTEMTIKKIGDEFWLFSGMESHTDSDLKKFVLLKFTPDNVKPECVEIRPGHLAKDFIRDMREATDGNTKLYGGYVADRIRKDGQLKVDYYTAATLGYDGNVYALKSVTEYVLTGEEDKCDILKRDVLCVWNASGELVKEIQLQTADENGEVTDFYYSVFPSAYGVLLFGYHNGEFVCAKLAEDGSFVLKQSMQSTAHARILTDDQGRPCRVVSVPQHLFSEDSPDGVLEETEDVIYVDEVPFVSILQFFDENLQIVRKEKLPEYDGYHALDGDVFFLSDDEIVYSADEKVRYCKLGAGGSSILAAFSNTPVMIEHADMIFYEPDDASFYALYPDPDSGKPTFAKFTVIPSED